MKFTYQWLKEYCPCDLTPEELVRLMTMHGLKVEETHPFGDDTVFELEITANRPDCLGLLGVAREVALLTDVKPSAPKLPKPKQLKSRGVGTNLIKIEVPELCPLYIGRVIRGVKVRPSPDWLQNRLEAIGLRPINNIVDITNFVLYESGQPLHAFDLARLNESRLIVRCARPGEKIMAIDDKEYQPTKDTLVIADAEVPVAIAGVMGGKATEVTESTTDILLESAIFLPSSIRKTSRHLKLSSDSSYRFERGINPEGVEWASQRAAALIKELAGGTITELCAVNYLKRKTRKITLRLANIPRLLGIGVEKSEIKRILKGLGFIIRKEWKGQIEMTIAPFRPDINIEVDVIEEIARIIGYEQIPITPPFMTPAVFPAHKIDKVNEFTSRYLTGLGYNEVLTNSFLEEKYLTDFAVWSDQPALGLLNTEGVQDRFLRSSLLPGLLITQRINQGYSNEADKVNLFEIAKGYYRNDSKPSEKFLLALLDRKGFYSLKGTLNQLFNELGLPASPAYRTGGSEELQVQPADTPCFKKGQSVKFIYNGQLLGWLGELAETLVDKYELRESPALAELDFELLTKAAHLDRRFQDFSRYPAIVRDVAMIFDKTVSWGEIESVIKKDAPEFLEDIRFFDLYEGKNIPSDKKSLAFSLSFRAADRTLTHTEIDEVIKGVIDRLTNRYQAVLRANP